MIIEKKWEMLGTILIIKLYNKRWNKLEQNVEKWQKRHNQIQKNVYLTSQTFNF